MSNLPRTGTVTGSEPDSTTDNRADIASCGECGAALYPTDRYCPCCGTRPVRRCAHCGTESLHPVAHFCTQCGEPLANRSGAPRRESLFTRGL